MSLLVCASRFRSVFGSVDAYVLPSLCPFSLWKVLDGIQCWNFLSCAYWAHMEVLVDEKGRIALSCHFAPDILCDKSETRLAQEHCLEHHCP